MTSDGPVLVTGASGNVGRQVARLAVAAGWRVRAAGRDPTRLAELPELDGADPVRFDFAALEGVDRVFLMRPPDVSDTARVIRPVIERMRDVGVRHVTFLSLLGVNPALPHWRVERDLLAAGLPTTFLRAGFFAQNLGDAYRADIREHDRIRLPAGRGRTSVVDVRDVAAVATLSLDRPERHRGQAYDLTARAPSATARWRRCSAPSWAGRSCTRTSRRCATGGRCARPPPGSTRWSCRSSSSPPAWAWRPG
jgi:uncharacterized protein YbjT (DUF2867 family)